MFVIRTSTFITHLMSNKLVLVTKAFQFKSVVFSFVHCFSLVRTRGVVPSSVSSSPSSLGLTFLLPITLPPSILPAPTSSSLLCPTQTHFRYAPSSCSSCLFFLRAPICLGAIWFLLYMKVNSNELLAAEASSPVEPSDHAASAETKLPSIRSFQANCF